MAEATVQMRGIRKQFPFCVFANDNVDFTAYRGEIHALYVGENGAGKKSR